MKSQIESRKPQQPHKSNRREIANQTEITSNRYRWRCNMPSRAVAAKSHIHTHFARSAKDAGLIIHRVRRSGLTGAGTFPSTTLCAMLLLTHARRRATKHTTPPRQQQFFTARRTTPSKRTNSETRANSIGEKPPSKCLFQESKLESIAGLW